MAGTIKIIRLLSADMHGELQVGRALRKIKGISFMLSNAICTFTEIDAKKKIMELSSDELKKLEDAIKNPKIASWLLNRRKDLETGETTHLTGAVLDLKKREDINLLRKIRAYRGIRHEQGQPVRGQRTRSTFRTNKTVGVAKKSLQQKAAPKAEKK